MTTGRVPRASQLATTKYKNLMNPKIEEKSSLLSLASGLWNIIRADNSHGEQ